MSTVSCTREDQAAILANACERLMELSKKGQLEYAHGPAFGNFERLAKELGIPREKVLWIYLKKHLDGILSHINGYRSQREDVIGRLDDARVYLTLLEGMIRENRANGIESEFAQETLPETPGTVIRRHEEAVEQLCSDPTYQGIRPYVAGQHPQPSQLSVRHPRSL